MQFEKAAIIDALRELDKKDPQHQVFGANAHRYRLHPPLPLKEIEVFERKQGVALPDDYKYFITRVGNGGAGPFYGLFRFGEQDDLHDYCRWEQGYLIGDLAKDFPHSQAWNLPESFWAKQPDPDPDMAIEEEDRLMEAWDKLLEERYWNPDLMNGAIPICHLGCAYRQWLVITGKQKGFVWSDRRVDYKGISPLHRNGKSLTFADWYLGWLRDPKNAMKAAR